MKIRSISDIPASLFYSLKIWAEASPVNWNILVGICSIILIIGVVLWVYFYKKIGKEDEYSRNIYYKATVTAFIVIAFCDVLFPREYMWNLFFTFKYGLAFLISSFVLAIQYKKDFM